MVSSNTYILCINDVCKQVRYKLYAGSDRTLQERKLYSTDKLKKLCVYTIVKSCKKLKNNEVTQEDFIKYNKKYCELLLAIQSDEENGLDNYYIQKEWALINDRANVEKSYLFLTNSFNEIMQSKGYKSLFPITKAEKELMNAKNFVSFSELDRVLTPNAVSFATKIAERTLSLATTMEEQTK